MLARHTTLPACLLACRPTDRPTEQPTYRPAQERLAEGWSLVERIRGVGGGTCTSSLSYVVMLMEQPYLVEGHFAGTCKC